MYPECSLHQAAVSSWAGSEARGAVREPEQTHDPNTPVEYREPIAEETRKKEKKKEAETCGKRERNGKKGKMAKE